MKDGIIFYNVGNKMLLRLAVSVQSLRRVMGEGLPITIITEKGGGCVETCALADLLGVDSLVAEFDTPPGSKTPLLNKTRMAQVSPYERTVFLDADILVRRRFDELFDRSLFPSSFGVPQFADWKTKGKIRKRIRAWNDLLPEGWTDAACEFGPAINCGVFYFDRGCDIMGNWYHLALPGRSVSAIPDETCLQAILPQYDHEVLPPYYNCSCKYGNTEEAVILHYHGRKHCRIEKGQYLYRSEWWYEEMDRFFRHHDAGASWVILDRQLRKNLERRDKMKGGA